MRINNSGLNRVISTHNIGLRGAISVDYSPLYLKAQDDSDIHVEAKCIRGMVQSYCYMRGSEEE